MNTQAFYVGNSGNFRWLATTDDRLLPSVGRRLRKSPHLFGCYYEGNQAHQAIGVCLPHYRRKENGGENSTGSLPHSRCEPSATRENRICAICLCLLYRARLTDLRYSLVMLEIRR